MPDNEYLDIYDDWNQTLSMPRQIECKEGRMIQKPIDEILSLRKKKKKYCRSFTISKSSTSILICLWQSPVLHFLTASAVLRSHMPAHLLLPMHSGNRCPPCLLYTSFPFDNIHNIWLGMVDILPFSRQ